MQDQTIYTHPLVETSIIDIWMRKLLAKVTEKVSNFDAALLSEVSEQNLVEKVINPMQQVQICKEKGGQTARYVHLFLLFCCLLSVSLTFYEKWMIWDFSSYEID